MPQPHRPHSATGLTWRGDGDRVEAFVGSHGHWRRRLVVRHESALPGSVADWMNALQSVACPPLSNRCKFPGTRARHAIGQDAAEQLDVIS
jgi:hypothetical protein